MGTEDEQLSDQEQGELAAYSDGSLVRFDRPRVFDRLQHSPRLQALVDEQRASIVAVAVLDAPAPESLLERLDLASSKGAEETPALSNRRSKTVRLALAGALTAAIGAMALATALVTATAEPTIGDAADLAGRGASAPPPRIDPTNPYLLASSVAGVAFPNYAEGFGWRRSGERADYLEGRQTRTVFYRRGPREMAYSIIAGEPLPWPSDARGAIRDGVELEYLRYKGSAVVTWLRGGRTCVLSSADVGADELLDLAAWTGLRTGSASRS